MTISIIAIQLNFRTESSITYAGQNAIQIKLEDREKSFIEFIMKVSSYIKFYQPNF